MPIIDFIRNLFTEEEAEKLFPDLKKQQGVHTADNHPAASRNGLKKKQTAKESTAYESMEGFRVIDRIPLMRAELDEAFRNRHRRVANMGEQFWDGVLVWDEKSALLTEYERTLLRKICKKIVNGLVFSEEELTTGNGLLDTFARHHIDLSEINRLGRESSPIQEPSIREDYIRLKNIRPDDRQPIFKYAYQHLAIEDCNALNLMFDSLDRGVRNHDKIKICIQVLDIMGK